MVGDRYARVHALVQLEGRQGYVLLIHIESIILSVVYRDVYGKKQVLCRRKTNILWSFSGYTTQPTVWL
jgi:hypothetical protein